MPPHRNLRSAGSVVGHGDAGCRVPAEDLPPPSPNPLAEVALCVPVGGNMAYLIKAMMGAFQAIVTGVQMPVPPAAMMGLSLDV